MTLVSWCDGSLIVLNLPTNGLKYFDKSMLFGRVYVFDNVQAMTLQKLNHPGAQLKTFLALLAHQPAVVVQVSSSQGSVPRNAGSWMAVFKETLVGTVGGGHLEHVAIDTARDFLAGRSAFIAQEPTRFALGPALGQCCGGVVHLKSEPVAAADAESLVARLMPKLAPVALFGGGHVGHALANVLSTLPVALHWVDSRDGVFPYEVPGDVVCEQSDPPQAAVNDLTPQSLVLIMSFSHAEDLDIVAACLLRQRERGDLPFVGLIGSKTKWATFRHRLAARGFSEAELAHVTCPIGIAGIARKEPEVIAVTVAAQVLQVLHVLESKDRL